MIFNLKFLRPHETLKNSRRTAFKTTRLRKTHKQKNKKKTRDKKIENLNTMETILKETIKSTLSSGPTPWTPFEVYVLTMYGEPRPTVFAKSSSIVSKSSK